MQRQGGVPITRILMAILVVAAALASLPAAQSQASPGTWQATSYPSTPPGCAAGVWEAGALYLVRTPQCGISAGQTITFEKYTPATGQTEVLRLLPEGAAQATVRSLQGKLYIFAPQSPSLSQPTTLVYDPATGQFTSLASRMTYGEVHGPSYVQGSVLTLMPHSCLNACLIRQYDAATDSIQTIWPSMAPVGWISVSGVVWTGTSALILIVDDAYSARILEYDPATQSISSGPTLNVPGYAGFAGQFVQDEPTTWRVGIWVAPFILQMARLDLAAGTLHLEPGTLQRWPVVSGDGVLWALNFQTGEVQCLSSGAACPTPGPTTPPPGQGGGSSNEGVDGETLAAREPADSWHAIDTDGDGVSDATDDCPGVPDNDQWDTDHDGVGDACDTAPRGTVTAKDNVERGATLHDTDADGIVDAADNCLNDPNFKQEDLDGDALGDACDADADGDGVVEIAPLPGFSLDNCPRIPNPDQTDSDGDGKGDRCSPATPPKSAQPLGNVPVSALPGIPVSLWAWILGATALGALFAALARRRHFAILLFSRWAGTPPDHKTRSLLLEAVESHPGIHFNELARLVGKGRGAVKHHMAIMERAGQIRTVKDGPYLCIYHAAGLHRPGAATRKSEVGRRIEEMVHETPGITASEASRVLGVDYGTAAYHMRRLSEAGLVRLERNPLAAYPQSPSAT